MWLRKKPVERIPRLEKNVHGETVGNTETARAKVRAFTVRPLLSIYTRKFRKRQSLVPTLLAK